MPEKETRHLLVFMLANVRASVRCSPQTRPHFPCPKILSIFARPFQSRLPVDHLLLAVVRRTFSNSRGSGRSGTGPGTRQDDDQVGLVWQCPVTDAHPTNASHSRHCAASGDAEPTQISTLEQVGPDARPASNCCHTFPPIQKRQGEIK
ncbi:hypothetical protein LZ31DRAFT_129125 [Colletotrichum somersetense]|nr:hypothetical protein LZ31DRAFT_129125 [Colletotrichum somersetense]